MLSGGCKQKGSQAGVGAILVGRILRVAAVLFFLLGSGQFFYAGSSFAHGGAGHGETGSHQQPAIPSQPWSFSGPFGTFDRAQLQRGFKIYKDVCSSCHSMSLLSFRNLSESGGPEFSLEAVKVLAAEVMVEDGPNDTGDMFSRSGIPSDRFPSPFPNPEASRAANGGVLPPDLSLIAKARRGGADYIHALLTGYSEAPPHAQGAEGTYYNPYFAGFWIGMAPPLSDGLVEYKDGTPQTVDQYARDITAFLVWAAEPHLEARHRMGFVVLGFMMLFAVLLYLSKKRLWSRVEH